MHEYNAEEPQIDRLQLWWYFDSASKSHGAVLCLILRQIGCLQELSCGEWPGTCPVANVGPSPPHLPQPTPSPMEGQAQSDDTESADLTIGTIVD